MSKTMRGEVGVVLPFAGLSSQISPSVAPTTNKSARNSKQRSDKQTAAATMVPFKDDPRLVAVRYDQTVALEPPIPLPPPRSPLRSSHHSSLRGSSSTTGSAVNLATILPTIAITHALPPRRPPPPTEKHPALRTISTPRIIDLDMRRDSAHSLHASAMSPGSYIVQGRKSRNKIADKEYEENNNHDIDDSDNPFFAYGNIDGVLGVEPLRLRSHSAGSSIYSLYDSQERDSVQIDHEAKKSPGNDLPEQRNGETETDKRGFSDFEFGFEKKESGKERQEEKSQKRSAGPSQSARASASANASASASVNDGVRDGVSAGHAIGRARAATTAGSASASAGAGVERVSEANNQRPNNTSLSRLAPRYIPLRVGSSNGISEGSSTGNERSRSASISKSHSSNSIRSRSQAHSISTGSNIGSDIGRDIAGDIALPKLALEPKPPKPLTPVPPILPAAPVTPPPHYPRTSRAATAATATTASTTTATTTVTTATTATAAISSRISSSSSYYSNCNIPFSKRFGRGSFSPSLNGAQSSPPAMNRLRKKSLAAKVAAGGPGGAGAGPGAGTTTTTATATTTWTGSRTTIGTGVVTSGHGSGNRLGNDGSEGAKSNGALATAAAGAASRKGPKSDTTVSSSSPKSLHSPKFPSPLHAQYPGQSQSHSQSHPGRAHLHAHPPPPGHPAHAHPHHPPPLPHPSASCHSPRPNPILPSNNSDNHNAHANSANANANASDPSSPTISTKIPCESFFEDDDLNKLSFSIRGSLILGSKRLWKSSSSSSSNGTVDRKMADQDVSLQPHPNANAQNSKPRIFPLLPLAAPPKKDHTGIAPVRPPREDDMGIAAIIQQQPFPLPDSPHTLHPPLSPGGVQSDTASIITTPRKLPPSIRVISAEAEKESQKVRSLYESAACDQSGDDDDDETPSSPGGTLEPHPEVLSGVDANDAPPCNFPPAARPRTSATTASVRRLGSRDFTASIEDWDGVEVGNVDRYGFIQPHRRYSHSPSVSNLQASPPARRPSYIPTNYSTKNEPQSCPLSPKWGPSFDLSSRSLNTQVSEVSAFSRRSVRSTIRHATNKLPHNRDRRILDEAGDLLALQPGLSEEAEDESLERLSAELKRKEATRSEKWRKMAEVVISGSEGQATVFHFDPKHPKLVSRVWKGIPDCWRAAAWYSFLATSAMADPVNYVSDEDLKSAYSLLVEESSPDDTQIDLDVPRTINQHIMFRRRYRGGQRLLFRVLHALSLYFPDTGYVQGMAPLAATFLSYYDEEQCFIMLVRLWQFRGLNRIYQSGFVELMGALKDFETYWLNDKEAAENLKNLCIDPTAYATRWYLTLFNLSIPFPVQLRVWDVFMLLGSTPPERLDSSSTTGKEDELPSSLGLEILHATGLAIVDTLHATLIDSDFENAMKSLTSWVPIKDEQRFMEVVQVEWRKHQYRQKKKG